MEREKILWGWIGEALVYCMRVAQRSGEWPINGTHQSVALTDFRWTFDLFSRDYYWAFVHCWHSVRCAEGCGFRCDKELHGSLPVRARPPSQWLQVSLSRCKKVARWVCSVASVWDGDSHSLYTVLQSSTEFYTVLHSSTEYYRVLQSTTEFYTVLQSSLHSSTEFYRVLYTVLHSSTQFSTQFSTVLHSSLQFSTQFSTQLTA